MQIYLCNSFRCLMNFKALNQAYTNMTKYDIYIIKCKFIRES